ncbi:MAG: hypothetical protein H6937_10695 [Burkholderiales bacterium]|nr:hypothetical protein [Burkholderiales bacterium]MDR4516295.1 hypothetical protein [Nitrosomonas sp.]
MTGAQKGFIYLWALFAVAVAGVVMAGTGQVWQTKSQREKELELLFIGEQFRKAIMSYYNNQLTGIRQYPESLEDLLEDKRGPVPVRHLRKIYIDPLTMTDEWGVVEEEDVPQQAQGQNRGNNQNNANNPASSSFASTRKGIVGVYSLSGKRPVKRENFPEHFAKFSEAQTYRDWQFIHTQQSGSGTNTSQQRQQGATGAGASPFGTPGGASRPGQGAQGGASAPASPLAPPASAQSGQNPFAQ